ncbi:MULTISPECIES: transcription-repair coupling factor [Staphylococcus]|uniref:Transcription-repair-coupling factor n=1 Tax=Staphylococcus lugdunensis TaxID=28035 RepID=A0ABX6BTU2_STALU|nr:MULTISPECIES: transcription-repair coupling factor [Staphylococcus]ARJ10138.1 transcription-repair coupling factor [Staphylococcus lugdunensis]ARJ17179.1 transcription-repair coupling factor [Staphylococcus lugdunensis]EKS20883.1 transcription-repair-coupling factor [Staphylococcus lugdunensis ACS-027-V-Sch2]MCH8652502.1 transcription-repair coupling factor [Staphylococcus lugdunensis]MCH8657548.1 transcription-repair coupling factor [Staphylococcus lugdunensis]
MKSVIAEYIQQDKRFQELDQVFGQENILVTGLSPSAKATIIAEKYLTDHKQMLLITNNLYQADKLETDLLQYIDSAEVYKYPVQDIMTEEFSTQSPQLMSERVRTLTALAQNEKGLFIVPLNGLKKWQTPIDIWQAHQIHLHIGQDIDVAHLLQQLVNMGYRRESVVSHIGEFSVRGGIIDIYPLIGEPVRIELFDTEVDSIRDFDIETQRSNNNLDGVSITSASDYVITDDVIKHLQSNLKAAYEDTRPKIETSVRNDLKETYESFNLIDTTAVDHQLLRRLVAFMYETPATLIDYFQQDAIVVVDEYNRIKETEETLTTEVEDFIHNLIESGNGFIGQTFMQYDGFEHLLTHFPVAYFTLFTSSMTVKLADIIKFSCKPVQQFYGQYDIMRSEFQRYVQNDYTIVVLVETETKVERIQAMLNEMHIPTVKNIHSGIASGQAIVTEGSLSEGFELPYMQLVVITERELFKTKQKKQRKRSKTISNAEKIKSYQDLKVGDYVVHVHHGVGRYLGVETLEVGDVHRDYIKLQYKGTDQLFVPVDQMDQVQKYVASEDKSPKLNKLGGSEWKKTKAKVQQSVEDIAEELIALYKEREMSVGYQFGEDTAEQQAFELDFPYELTPDQAKSIEEIKADMELQKPMDRLLCGDVGYGKTEVAIRAAFKAVMEGKQVAFLVPTTILAQQHYETLIERMQDFPVEIQLVSRFRTAKEVRKTKEGLKSGYVDIVVGTHKLLSKDIRYKDLGLLIVDEEQRFGVRHKERIKTLKTNVDVLTLTATPIPRTLHMSMLGVRDLSVIETPPENRFPVQTYVLEQNTNFIKEALERELSRDGQVFYLYNKVQSIYEKREQLQMLMPEASIAVAHGQMTERDLEETMLSFINGDYDILVTTTIIETGVDVPNANTLIIEEADRFGLSQLYQLRGRVGRSSRIGYAYFLHPTNKVLTETAEDRLQAIKEFTELGSGFKIAMRDLNIRGAGNLLGKQQHGFIDSVGFDLYSQMLEEAVNEKRGITEETPDTPEVEMVLNLDAYLPAEYIQNEQAKIEIYKKLRKVENEAQLDHIRDELMDRFNDYPIEVERLLDSVQIKMHALRAGVTLIKDQGKTVDITLSVQGTKDIDGEALFKQTQPLGRAMKVGVQDGVMKVTLKKSTQWLENLKFLVKCLEESRVIKDEDEIRI